MTDASMTEATMLAKLAEAGLGPEYLRLARTDHAVAAKVGIPPYSEAERRRLDIGLNYHGWRGRVQ